MKIGVGYLESRTHERASGFRKVQVPVIKETQGVSTNTASKNHSPSRIKRNLCRAVAFDPSLDRKVLKLQAGRISYAYRVAIAIKDKPLSHSSGGITYVSHQGSMVGAARIERIVFSWPPTDQAGRNRSTGLTLDQKRKEPKP